MPDKLTVHWIGGRFDGDVEVLAGEHPYLPGFGGWRWRRDDRGRVLAYALAVPWDGVSPLYFYWDGLKWAAVAAHAERFTDTADDGYDGWLATDDRWREGSA